MAQSSAWRVNDAAAYEALRTTATTLTARLLEVAWAGGPTADEARRAACQVREEALQVDGYDRRAVDALSSRFTAHLRSLQENP